MARRMLAEAAGTALLVLVGVGAAMHGGPEESLGTWQVALAFGVAVAAAVALFGPVSGAHINPAVTLGFWRAGRFPGADVAPYILAQCLGAIGGSLVLRAAWGTRGGLGATLPHVGVPQSFLLEALWSALLMLVILLLTGPRPRGPAAVALGIGVTVLVGAGLLGPATGGSFNPARSLGPAVAGGGWEAHWVYWVAPLVGMLVVGRAFRRTNRRTDGQAD